MVAAVAASIIFAAAPAFSQFIGADASAQAAVAGTIAIDPAQAFLVDGGGAAAAQAAALADAQAAAPAPVQMPSSPFMNFGSGSAGEGSPPATFSTPAYGSNKVGATRSGTSTSGTSTGSNGTSSSAAAIAVQFAYKQLGKPYVWGADGPNSYDCSGLTMAAWGKAGVKLPHHAAYQYATIKHHVSRNELQPGDLLFFGSPIHHVGMYVHGNIMINAYDGVELSDWTKRHDLTGAARP